MSLKDATLRVAVLKVLSDEVVGQLAEAKREAEDAFKAAGATQAVPELPGGQRVATATYAGADGKAAAVTGPNALLEWVRDNHPEEVVTSVRGSYLEKLLKEARQAGKAVDPATGQVVPGITVRDSRPYVSVRFKDGGKEAVVAAWRAGELRDIDLVAPRAIGDGEAA